MTTLQTYVRRSGSWKKFRDGTTTGGNDPLPQIPTISAEKFREYWGTRIFPTYSNATGGELVDDHSHLTTLMPKYVTHKVEPNLSQGVINLIQNLAAEGTKSVLTVGAPFTTYSSSQWTNMMNTIASLPNCILMVTGQNEVNHVRGGGSLPSNWKEQARDHQQELWNRMQTVNATFTANGDDTVLVGNPNLWSGDITKHDNDLAALAPMVVNYCNAIVYHLYPRGGHPDWNLDAFINNYKSKYGANRPVFCTEAGYFAAANYNGGAKVVSEYAHDIYLRKMWLEYASRDAYIGQFEFLNDPDASESNREAWFGIIKTPSVSINTWEPRIVYNKLITMQSYSGGSDGTIGCKIESSGPIRSLAVNHSGGNILYLWRSDDIESDRVKINLTPREVVVTSQAGGTQTVYVSDEVVRINI